MSERIGHILNRGVEGRKIFLDKKDYLRFTHNLFDFNDKNDALSYYDRRSRNLALGEPSEVFLRKRREKKEIVDVLCWALIPNHHHILAQEKKERGLGMYSQKLASGHTQYFNNRNNRKGVLFQGKSKIILVNQHAHFLHLPFYILTNPVDLIQPGWREEGIKNPKRIFEFLENYQWSALPDLIGKANFPETINKKLFYELFNTNEKQFKRDLMDWLSYYEGEFDFDN